VNLSPDILAVDENFDITNFTRRENCDSLVNISPEFMYNSTSCKIIEGKKSFKDLFVRLSSAVP
jgi:hypothetical protein